MSNNLNPAPVDRQIAYLCDRKQCEHCTYPECSHTFDIYHAVNFTNLQNPDGFCRYYGVDTEGTEAHVERWFEKDPEEFNFWVIPNHSRPSKTEYYLNIAAVVASRSTCLRRQYGAVIVKDDEIIATGYNGSARGMENCSDKGECWREANHIPHGEQYEKCQSVHAEANAIISASRKCMVGATIYLAGFENHHPMKPEDVEPCEMCKRMIINAGLMAIVTGPENTHWTPAYYKDENF